MSHIFISYSRKDIDLAREIVDALARNELETWIDWKSIPKGEDWEQEIYRGIEKADAFLFLISPDSATSEICNKEIAHAAKNNKRILPIVIRDTDVKTFLYELANKEISRRNWIFCRKESDNFDKAVGDILTTIRTDYVWLKYHTRLQVKALEWERNHKEISFLLRGKDLQDAEFQFETDSSKEPYPTAIQSEYIITSRRTEDMQRRSMRLRRNVSASIGIALLITIVIAQRGYFNRLIYRPLDMEDYWAIIPAGEFQMGSENGHGGEIPVHTVYLDEFRIGKYEVTNRQYAQCMRARICLGSVFGADKDLHPVLNVSWSDAKAYCEWVGGRLPTEAEWEKAASWDDQAMIKRTYPWGETIDCSYANYFGKDGGRGFCVGESTPVGSYDSGQSPYGLYDMAGNVWEWVNDWYDETYYQNSPASNPLGPESGEFRVIRGGGWGDSNTVVRSDFRYWYFPSNARFDLIGFRCAGDTAP